MQRLREMWFASSYKPFVLYLYFTRSYFLFLHLLVFGPQLTSSGPREDYENMVDTRGRQCSFFSSSSFFAFALFFFFFSFLFFLCLLFYLWTGHVQKERDILCARGRGKERAKCVGTCGACHAQTLFFLFYSLPRLEFLYRLLSRPFFFLCLIYLIFFFFL